MKQGLGDEQFDAVVEHLGATLRELGAAEPLVAEALAIVGDTRREVLDR